MESTESSSKHHRHDEDARPEDEHVAGLTHFESPNATNEHVANGHVEEAP